MRKQWCVIFTNDDDPSYSITISPFDSLEEAKSFADEAEQLKLAYSASIVGVSRKRMWQRLLRAQEGLELEPCEVGGLIDGS